jgi:hypothetical protein
MGAGMRLRADAAWVRGRGPALDDEGPASRVGLFAASAQA